MRYRPSLRANGSRECAPDDKLREAIHDATTEEWIASSLLLLAMTKTKVREEHNDRFCKGICGGADLDRTRGGPGGGGGGQGRADAELVCLWRARAVLLRQGQGHLC